LVKEISERGTAMNQRMKMVREALGMSQANFAESADIGLGVIKNIDSNRTEPNDHFYNVLCARYNINRTWLETGEGEMFAEMSRAEKIGRFVAEVLADEPDSFRRKLIDILIELDADGWQKLKEAADTGVPTQAMPR
jgi:DNA-binding XRE family transcriptional regulator